MLKIFLALVFVYMSAFGADIEVDREFNLLFFGAFGMIVIYNFAYNFVLKDVVYTHYFIFHLFVFVIMLFYTGLFDDALLEFSINGVPIGFFLLAALALLALSRSMLELDRTHKKIDEGIKYLQFILLFAFSLTIFPIGETVIVDITTVFIVLLAAGLLGLSAYLSFVEKNTYAWFFFLGFSSLLLSMIISLLSYFNLIEQSAQIMYIIEFSLIFEATVFSFALSHRHKETTLHLRQNELLFKELSHRVKNNLQSIISILSLQKSRASKDESKKYLQDTINRIRAIFMIHEHLQNSNVVAKVEMKTYLNRMMEPYKLLNTEVKFQIECADDLNLSLDKLTPLALIINELITNSIKYAFIDIEEPKILLAFTKDKEYQFIYEDNGLGYDEITESLGSLLIKNLSTSQLKGVYTIDAEKKFNFKIIF